MSDLPDNKKSGNYGVDAMKEAMEKFRNRGTNPEAPTPPPTPELKHPTEIKTPVSNTDNIEEPVEEYTEMPKFVEPEILSPPVSKPPLVTLDNTPNELPTLDDDSNGENNNTENNNDDTSRGYQLSDILPGQPKTISDILPSSSEVDAIISEPEERINVEEFIKDLEQDVEDEIIKTELEMEERAIKTGGRDEREEKRQRLLQLAKDPNASREHVFKAINQDQIDRAIDMKTADDFQFMSSAAISVINALFANDDCSEIHGSAPDKLFARYKGQRVEINAEFASKEEYNNFLKSLVDRAETFLSWDELVEKSTGVVRLADGSSLTLMFPPFTKHACFTVRKHTAQHWDFDALVDNGTLNNFMAEFLKTAVAGRANIVIAGEMGSGKSLPVSSLVLTPGGYVKMGDIMVGDQVIGKNGKPIEVIGVYPQGERDIYEVIFTDGSKAECDGEHLWQVKTALRKWRKQEGEILTLNEIKNNLYTNSGNIRYFIPMTDPVEFTLNNEDKELVLDPYLIGALLGDGSFRGGSIKFSTADKQMIELIKPLLPEGITIKHINNYDYRLTLDNTKRSTHINANKLKNEIKNLGLYNKKSHDKFIPKEYLTGSTNQRLKLLQGLFDTDGSAAKSNVEFSTVSEQLAKDVQFLVQSFGGTGTIVERHTSYAYNKEKKQGRLSYRVSCKLPNNIQPFKLQRKIDKFHVRNKYVDVTRGIKEVNLVRKEDAQCIKVEAADGLFLTNDFIVTHNTTLLSLLTQYISDGERIALLQEVPEIFVNKPDVIKINYYPMMLDNLYTIDKAIDTALYMRFDRMIVGEMHDKGLFYLLKVMRTGGDGSMSTFHAGSAKELTEMFINHLQREEGGFTAETAAELVRSAVDIIVILEHQGTKHRVIEISEVDRRITNAQNSSMIATNMLWKFERTHNLEGKHINSGKLDEKGRVIKKLKRAGLEVNPEWFSAVNSNIEHEARRGRRG